MKVFITLMHRGDPLKNQTYIAGVSSNYYTASLYGKSEYHYRGGMGKYDFSIKEIELNTNSDIIYIIEMHNKDENFYYFDFKIFADKNDALLKFKRYKEENRYDNIKIYDYNLGDKNFSKQMIQKLHIGWYFLNNKEKESLRNIYSNFIFNN